jgi:hypothetical protein
MINIKQINAYALQYGLFLGLLGIASLILTGLSLRTPDLSFISLPVTLSSPFVAFLFCRRFRSQTATEEEGFSFANGFFFTFIMGLYASIWIAMFVFFYLRFFDHGYIFDAYSALLHDPATYQQLQEDGLLETLDAAGGIDAVIDTMRLTAPINYAGMVVYTTVISAPIVSCIIALIARRTPGIGAYRDGKF